MITGNQISKELQDALGLPKDTLGFTLRCYAGEVITVECEYCPDGSFQTALTEYHLTPRLKAKPSPAVLDFDAWMRERTERAHDDFMRRTSQPLMQEALAFTREQIARFFKVPPELLADSK